MEGRQRAYGVWVLFQPLQQLPGLFQAALPDPQIGQPDDRRSTSFRHPPVKMPSSVDELHLGLLPAPSRGQDAPVVRAAKCADHIPAGHHLRCGSHPLVRAYDVID